MNKNVNASIAARLPDAIWSGKEVIDEQLRDQVEKNNNIKNEKQKQQKKFFGVVRDASFKEKRPGSKKDSRKTISGGVIIVKEESPEEELAEKESKDKEIDAGLLRRSLTL